MIKVYENFDFSRVGQMQSLLEAHGIETFIKNQYGSSVMGEVPFVEVVPQLFILKKGELARAKEILQLDLPSDEPLDDWVCPECGVDVEGNFGSCWKCGMGRAEG